MSTPTALEHLDVVFVGAGISGIGAAYFLQRDHPQRSYAILEARGATGGTWDLFRYPGIRSDSDVQTFGYAFKPWNGDAVIASGQEILDYLRETAAEHGIDAKIRLRHEVVAAAWSTEAARWTVTVRRGDTGETEQLTCSWLFCASGYYRYDRGFTPRFAGQDSFSGRVVHPQAWPADLDPAGQRIVVIGSGATAVTLVPELAKTAAHVTMLQRTPSYVLPIPQHDHAAALLRGVLGSERAHALTRRKNIAIQRALYRFCRRFPTAARRLIRRLNVDRLPKGYPVDEHFNPPYAPWDQRLCMVPGGDLFTAIRRGSASVVTGAIERFTERGIRLASGEELEADLIVTATGLVLRVFGGIALTVDGVAVHVPDKVAFKGMMLDGVPNFVFAIGYTNASWTLKVGLLCEHFCRLLTRMDAAGHQVCRAERVDPTRATRPLLDFQAGYVLRSLHELPRQGDAAPWLMPMDYALDTELFEAVDDEQLVFEPGAPSRT